MEIKNTSVLQLIWTALQQARSYIKLQVRALWIRELKDDPLAPYIITKQTNGDKLCKIIQAGIRAQRGPNGGIGLFRRTGGTDIEPKLAPRTHAFLYRPIEYLES